MLDSIRKFAHKVDLVVSHDVLSAASVVIPLATAAVLVASKSSDMIPTELVGASVDAATISAGYLASKFSLGFVSDNIRNAIAGDSPAVVASTLLHDKIKDKDEYIRSKSESMTTEDFQKVVDILNNHSRNFRDHIMQLDPEARENMSEKSLTDKAKCVLDDIRNVVDPEFIHPKYKMEP